jgi:hypothetical protein
MRAALACLFLCCLTTLIGAENFSAVSADEQAIIEQTNVQRKRMGLPELRRSAVLCSVARKHAVEMAKANKLSHRLNGKSSSDRVDAAGYKWTTVSENIAWNQRSVAEVMDGWMRSDGHRTNLLGNDISEMGAGIAANSKGELYFVQVFARPESATKFATLKFTVRNATDSTLRVDVRVGKLFTLTSGESAKYTLTTPDATPSISVGDGRQALEIKIRNDAHYALGKREGRIELYQDPEMPKVERAR